MMASTNTVTESFVKIWKWGNYLCGKQIKDFSNFWFVTSWGGTSKVRTLISTCREKENLYLYFEFKQMIFLLLCSCPRKGWQRIFPDHWNIWIKGTARIFLLTGPLAEPDKRRPSLKMTARSYSWTTWCDRHGDLQRIIIMINKEWSWS